MISLQLMWHNVETYTVAVAIPVSDLVYLFRVVVKGATHLRTCQLVIMKYLVR